MKKVRVLLVKFNQSLRASEVSAFRGAVIEKVGREPDVFHNHQINGKTINRYPLIQYKVIDGKAGFFCVDKGVDEIHHFFTQKNWTLKIADRKVDLAIDKLDLNNIVFQVWNKPFHYRLHKWLALNAENHRKFDTLTSDAEKKDFLTAILKGNILSMAKGIGWTVDKQVEVTQLEVENARKYKFKNVPLIGFEIKFQCNVYLPSYIGIGKGASHGFGMVKQYRPEKNKPLVNETSLSE